MITVNEVPIDITGVVVKFSFKLSDGSGDTTTIIGSSSGTVVGLATFEPTVEEMGNAGQYLYDIQRDDNGSISTHLSGTMLLAGDVTP